MLAYVAILVAGAEGTWRTLASGALIGGNDLTPVAAKRFRVKEVARFYVDRPSEILGLRAAFATRPGSISLHIWKDIDHEWPFFRFEEDLVSPIRFALAGPKLNRWVDVPLGRRKVVLRNPGYLYVGLIATPQSPQLAIDSRLDQIKDSRFEVVDLWATRTDGSYWPRANGDYAVSIRVRALPEPRRTFEDVTDRMGLSGARGGAVAWADVDGDGWEDLLLSGKVLYRNLGGKAFRDISPQSGLFGTADFGVFADVDIDGDLDLFTGGALDRLWLNDGNGSFKPSPGSLEDGLPSKSATWLDYDLDGLPDLFVANGADGISARCRLWRNQGEGKFKLAPIPEINGHRSKSGFYRSAVACDLDLDGRSEVAVSTLRQQPDQLWWISNRGARDRARSFGFDTSISPSGARTGGQGAGVASGDLDSDGRPDLWVANLMHPDWRGFGASIQTSMFLSRGALRRRGAEEMGLDFDESPADPTLGDFDNDGDLDAYVGSTYHHGDYYENVGGRFSNESYGSGAKSYRGESSAACDFDHDGRLDLAIQTRNRALRLYRNVGAQGKWLELQLRSNRNVIGASVIVQTDHSRYLRQAIAGKGLGSQDSAWLHFGLGPSRKVQSIRILWPGGRRQIVRGVKVDTRISLRG